MKNNSFSDSNQPVPPNVKALIGSPPPAGKGVHSWIYVSALKLHGIFPPEQIFAFLRAEVANCGRHVPDKEIEAAVVNSARFATGQISTAKLGGGSKAWPEVDHAAVQRVVASTEAPMARLFAHSGRYGLPQDQFEFVPFVVGLLFPGDPLICAGESVQTMSCGHLSEWGAAIAATQLIVPSPMTDRSGVNQQGDTSTRCLDNTGPRRFLVVEFDDLSIDEQAAIHVHLAARYPLALVVHSGGKSLHGWYFVAGRPEEELRAFMRYAVSLGADRHTWTPCQAVRTPGGIRRDKWQTCVQQVVYFNPNYAE